MNLLLIAAGIYLSARIISFIAGELTESEINKQKEIDKEIEGIRSHYQNTESNQNTVPNQNIEPTSCDEDTIRDNEVALAKKREICDFLRAEAKAREDDYAVLHEEMQ